jgi:hypothetical protein
VGAVYIVSFDIELRIGRFMENQFLVQGCTSVACHRYVEARLMELIARKYSDEETSFEGSRNARARLREV